MVPWSMVINKIIYIIYIYKEIKSSPKSITGNVVI